VGEDPACKGRDDRADRLSIRFQGDADLNVAIIRAARKIEPAIDFATSDESRLRGLPDPEVLNRVAGSGRILVSHDRRTMLNHFREHLAAGKESPGLLVASQDEPIGPVAEAIVFIWAVSDPVDLGNRVHHLPSLAVHAFAR
jgi:hypothetical protein